MAGKFFVLRQVPDFAPGLFENTVMEEGCVQLAHRGSGFQPTGQYTSPPYAAEGFFSLIPSWNADVPPGTTVEMQVRVLADGTWSRWFGFGAWSPWQEQASPPPAGDELAKVEGETLSLQDGRPAAGMVQLRVLLASADGSASPRVRLLAVSTNATQQMSATLTVFDRELELPAYSSLTRDPALAGHIAGATTLTMMANRWGRDLLPEEVARAVYDSTAARYGNLAYLAAAAGMLGFEGTVAYAGIAQLRSEIWQGRAVAARVHYQAPSIGTAATGEDTSRMALPVLKGATTGSTGHLVAIRGFQRREDQDYVVLHDPISPTDDAVRRDVPLADFARVYTGIALLMGKGAKGAGAARPQRRPARLELGAGRLRLFEGDTPLTAEALAAMGHTAYTLCYTLSDSIAYASAAQRKFYYPCFEEDGSVKFDAAAEGRRLTFYLIAGRGDTWVAEKRLAGDEGGA